MGFRRTTIGNLDGWSRVEGAEPTVAYGAEAYLQAGYWSGSEPSVHAVRPRRGSCSTRTRTATRRCSGPRQLTGGRP